MFSRELLVVMTFLVVATSKAAKQTTSGMPANAPSGTMYSEPGNLPAIRMLCANLLGSAIALRMMSEPNSGFLGMSQNGPNQHGYGDFMGKSASRYQCGPDIIPMTMQEMLRACRALETCMTQSQMAPTGHEMTPQISPTGPEITPHMTPTGPEMTPQMVPTGPEMTQKIPNPIPDPIVGNPGQRSINPMPYSQNRMLNRQPVYYVPVGIFYPGVRAMQQIRYETPKEMNAYASMSYPASNQAQGTYSMSRQSKPTMASNSMPRSGMPVMSKLGKQARVEMRNAAGIQKTTPKPDPDAGD